MSTTTPTWNTTSKASSAGRGGAAPASPSATAAGIDVKPHAVAQSDVTGMDASQIMSILNGLDPAGVTQAGQAHQELGQTLSRIAGRLAANAQTLSQNWQGAAAQAAMSRFQVMHDQTAQLAQQATQTGDVLVWLGTQVLPQFQRLPDPRVTSTTAHDEQTGATIGESVAGPGGALIGDGAGAVVGGVEHMLGMGNNGQAQANATAQKYLTALNEHLVTAYNAMPSPIGAITMGRAGGSPAPVSGSAGGAGGAGGVNHAPPVSLVSGPGGTGTTGGGGAVTPAGSGHAVSGGGPAGSGGSTASRISPVSSPSGASGLAPRPTGSLQGLTPAPGGGAQPGTGGPVPGATAPSGPGPGPGSGVPVPSGLSPRSGEASGPVSEDAAMLNEPVNESFPAIDGANGPGMLGAADPASATAADGAVSSAPLGTQAGDAAGSSVLGADNTAEDGMTGVPMEGGAGAARQEKDRRRQAWMNEDESIWGLPTDHVPPVIEGGG